MLDDIAATDPVQVVRKIGTELAPEARRHLHEALDGPEPLGSASREALTKALQCIELLEAQVHQLETALESRIVIEQAKGVLAERSGLSMELAFEAMRHHARDRNLRLADVARGVIDRSLVPGALDAARPRPS